LFTVEFFQKLPKQTRAIVQMCLYGLGAGSAAVLSSPAGQKEKQLLRKRLFDRAAFLLLIAHVDG
jgi:hypothetical protein